MKLEYEQATVSYSPDLTDPKARAVPIAVLVIGKVRSGKAGDGWIAVAAGIDAKRLGLDPLTAAMLSEVPHLIRRHVDAAMENLESDATPHSVLMAFFGSLKTSIHVSEITDRKTAEVSSAKAAFARVAEVANRSLIAKLAVVPSGRSVHGWAPHVPPKDLAVPVPETLQWQPRATMFQAAG